jgi:hypothetical protein
MEDLSKIISAGTGPIIVISACGLLCLAFYNRLSGMVARLRLFHRERLKEQAELGFQRASAQRDPAAVKIHQEMLEALQEQITEIMKRARLIRQALLCFLLTIACLSLCSLVLGLSVLRPGLIVASVVFFVVGMMLLVVGVIFTILELSHALHPVELESQLISEIVDAIDKV